MTYNEKTSWLTLVCMGVAYGIYFPLVATRPVPPTLIDILWLFGPIAGTQGLVVLVGSMILAARAGGKAARQPDERDRAIERRGASAGYYTLMVGMILVGVIMPFTEKAPHIVNTALFALVIAEAVRLILVVTSYRRGWHG